MKKLFATATLAMGISTPCLAEMPAGVYPGTMTAKTYTSMNTAKPISSKTQVIVVVNADGSGGVLTETIPLSGNGIIGSSHAFVSLSGPNSIGTLSLHFGKDFKTAKGVLHFGTGTDPGAGSSVEGKLKLKRAETEPPVVEPPIIVPASH